MWDKMDEIYKTKEPIDVIIKTVVSGGVVAENNGVKIFIPASQLGEKYVKDLNEYINKSVSVRIIELNRKKKKVVASQRILMAEEKKVKKQELWDNIEKGKVYTGKVKGLTNFGAFVDIGGVDGLVHITELSWAHIKHPSEVINVGDSIEVFILDFDAEKQKISLGYRKTKIIHGIK